MRTATDETVRALRRVIRDTPYSRWARENGLHPATVHAALNGYPMKAKRENTIRTVLGLAPVETVTVEIIPGKQYIVTRTRQRDEMRRSIANKPDIIKRLDLALLQRGYRSFNEYWWEVGCPFFLEGTSSELEQG